MASRNKIVALGREYWWHVASRLWAGGVTHAAITDELAEMGVAEDDLPGRNSYTAFRGGPEYGEFVAHQTRLAHKTQQKAAMYEAMERSGGTEGMVNYSLYLVLDKLADLSSKDCELDELTKLANSINRVASTIQMGDKARLIGEIARLKAEIEQPETKKAITGEDIVREFDRILGVPQPQATAMSEGAA